MVEGNPAENRQELIPESPLSFLEFIAKIEKWLTKVVKPSLNVNSVRALDDEPLIKMLIYVMEYVDIELYRNLDEGAVNLKRQAAHVKDMIDLLLRKDSDDNVLQNTLNLLIEGLRDFQNLDHTLIDDNFMQIQQLGKLDLSRIANIVESEN